MANTNGQTVQAAFARIFAVARLAPAAQARPSQVGKWLRRNIWTYSVENVEDGEF